MVRQTHAVFYSGLIFLLGPPGQVAAIAGKKAGMKQGELDGVLKELGYTEEQVKFFVLLVITSAPTYTLD